MREVGAIPLTRHGCMGTGHAVGSASKLLVCMDTQLCYGASWAYVLVGTNDASMSTCCVTDGLDPAPAEPACAYCSGVSCRDDSRSGKVEQTLQQA